MWKCGSEKKKIVRMCKVCFKVVYILMKHPAMSSRFRNIWNSRFAGWSIRIQEICLTKIDMFLAVLLIISLIQNLNGYTLFRENRGRKHLNVVCSDRSVLE